MVVTSTEKRAGPRQAQQGDRKWSTVVQAVSADGFVVPSYIILAGETHLASWTRDNPLPLDWRIAVTNNGWTTNKKGSKMGTAFQFAYKRSNKGCKTPPHPRKSRKPPFDGIRRIPQAHWSSCTLYASPFVPQALAIKCSLFFRPENGVQRLYRGTYAPPSNLRCEGGFLARLLYRVPEVF
ncbi:hypothetical protein NPX13_g4208 [Xylaria arbuscula]|uniref:DDE-1 domain-containing protein n=1 Tax=Xylaria arbuscula TaxID=114810 RepID=A0A9W8NGX7_9PEZI|nr:hypothetical protein NPX13_g4208 [Xylaria arbuscula]